MSAAGSSSATSAGPGGWQSGISLGQAEPIGLSGATGGPTSAPGFWPLVAGSLPGLDLDGDGAPGFLDDDDDGDGLPDVVETRTGVFAGPGDTGTDPLDADSDGDGFLDGEEVALRSDPNDPASTPAASKVPALPLGGWIALLCLIGIGGAAFLRPTRRFPFGSGRELARARRSPDRG